MADRFQILPGFRDFYPDECGARNYVFETWREVARRYGFVEYDGPILEPTDLYRKKSGDEIVHQLFCFEDKGSRDVAMRPELTPTLARMATARQRDFRKPLRWFSIGQFFRYERHQKGRGREFYQFNCDILGEPSCLADAELVALAIDLMRAFGFTQEDFKIRLSDRDAWVNFARSHEVDEANITNFLQIIDKMERTPEEKTVELLSPLGISLESVKQFIKNGSDASPAVQQILADLSARGMAEYVEVDFSIVRGLAYYTGAVYEVFDISKGMRAVAGGGRYDQLLGLIGGVDMPACGFAMGDMVITDLIRACETPASRLAQATAAAANVDGFVIIADESKRPDAMTLTHQLRASGFRVIYSFGSAKVGKQFQAAEQSGAGAAIVIGSEFPEITVKLLKEREEFTATPDTVIPLLRSRLTPP